MNSLPRFVATKEFYGATRYLTDKLNQGVALGMTVDWKDAKGFTSQAEVDEFVAANEHTRGQRWTLTLWVAPPRFVAAKALGGVDDYRRRYVSRLCDDFTYEVEEAREFASQAEIDVYIRLHADKFVPGRTLTQV